MYERVEMSTINHIYRTTQHESQLHVLNSNFTLICMCIYCIDYKIIYLQIKEKNVLSKIIISKLIFINSVLFQGGNSKY